MADVTGRGRDGCTVTGCARAVGDEPSVNNNPSRYEKSTDRNLCVGAKCDASCHGTVVLRAVTADKLKGG